jgi:GNAT superfamily N-acetyltransferase
MPVTRTLNANELGSAFRLGGEDLSGEAVEMFRAHPDLFLGRFDRDAILGVCCGWPVLHEREGTRLMRLELIAVAPGLQGRGHGRQLLEQWEARVAERGDAVIDVGSAADGFFLRHGYTPVEYCLKVPPEVSPDSPIHGSEPVAPPKAGGSPSDVLYLRIEDGYDAVEKARLARHLGASTAITIFRKSIAGRRSL